MGLAALIIARLVTTPARWTPAIGALFGVYTLIGSLREPFVLMRLTHPETIWTGVAAVLMIALAFVAAAMGLIATLRRPPHAHTQAAERYGN